jgi:hypothetical protein
VRVDLGLVRIDVRTNRVSAITPLADLDGSAYQVERGDALLRLDPAAM